jgi:hypothetical protein
MRLITDLGEPVALVVNGDLAVFEPGLEARGPDDPLLRFVAAMCALAMEIEVGLVAERYDDERAEGHAREALMPTHCFAALAALPDAYLATCFGVPHEQVPARRAELGLGALDGGADCRPGQLDSLSRACARERTDARRARLPAAS